MTIPFQSFVYITFFLAVHFSGLYACDDGKNGSRLNENGNNNKNEDTNKRRLIENESNLMRMAPVAIEDVVAGGESAKTGDDDLNYEKRVQDAMAAGIKSSQKHATDEVQRSVQDAKVEQDKAVKAAAKTASTKAVEDFSKTLQVAVERAVKSAVTSAVQKVVDTAVKTQSHFRVKSNCLITPTTKNMDRELKLKFRDAFNNSPNKIVKRYCQSCTQQYKNLYYKRESDLPKEDYKYEKDGKNVRWRLADILTKSWTDNHNKREDDFYIYSHYEDAVKNDKDKATKLTSWLDDEARSPQGKDVYFCVEQPPPNPTEAKAAKNILQQLSMMGFETHLTENSAANNFDYAMIGGAVGFAIFGFYATFLKFKQMEISRNGYMAIDGDDNTQV